MTKFDGEFIYKWRVEHQMTQEQAAELLGVASGTLRNWEQGLRSPPEQARRLIERLRPSDYPKATGITGRRPLGVRSWNKRKP